MQIKNIIILGTVFAITAGFIACGEEEQTEETAVEETAPTDDTTEETGGEDEEEAETGGEEETGE